MKGLSLEEAKQEFIKRGFIPLFKTYKNGEQKLLARTQEGYKILTTMECLKDNRNHHPRIFHSCNPYTIYNIKLWLKLHKRNKKIKLLSFKWEGIHKNLQWKCLKKNCGEIFYTPWAEISQGRNCPFCRGRKVGISNCLARKFPEIAKEWHLTKNGSLTPYEVTCGTGKKIWWQCKDCNYEWPAAIYSRTGKIKSNCPVCSESKGELKISEYLKLYNIKFQVQKQYIDLIGSGRGLLSYDFYLPNYNLLIEYQGNFHDGSSGEYTQINLEKQLEHDKRKREYAEQNNIQLLEIWYYDFKNIKTILDKELEEIKNNDNFVS